LLRRYGIAGVTQDGAANIPLTQFYDTHTDGSFSTAAGAVPEPSTWAMMLMGFGGLGWLAQARRRKTSPA
jgi:PEP-CTERM motif-containing protein